MIWYIESGHWLLHWFFVNLVFKMVLSLSYLSVLKWRPSFRAPTFGMNYMNLLTVVISLQFVSVSNWLQNLNQSKFVPSHLLIFNFGSFTFTVFFLNCLSLFPSFFCSNICSSSIFMVSCRYFSMFFIMPLLKALFLSVILFCFSFFFLSFFQLFYSVVKLFKVYNKNNTNRCKICLKLSIKTPKGCH